MTSRYNVRGAVGKRKGKFVKANVKQKIENFLEITDGKQGRRIQVSFCVFE